MLRFSSLIFGVYGGLADEIGYTVDIWGRMKWARLSGASLDSLKKPVGGVVGDVGKSPESAESENNPRRGGGGRFNIDLPGLIMGMAEDDGEGEEGEVGADDEEAIAGLYLKRPRSPRQAELEQGNAI